MFSPTVPSPSRQFRPSSERNNGSDNADHRARVTVDAVDERRADPVEGERAGDAEWLASSDVGGDLIVGRRAESHDGLGHADATARPQPSITQWPVVRTPVRPRIDFQRITASSADDGLPSDAPSSASIESHPTTTASGCGDGHHRRLCGGPIRSRGSRSTTLGRHRPHRRRETMTSGENPAIVNCRKRAGEALARIKRRFGTPPIVA